jgi:hypothetical protein
MTIKYRTTRIQLLQLALLAVDLGELLQWFILRPLFRDRRRKNDLVDGLRHLSYHEYHEHPPRRMLLRLQLRLPALLWLPLPLLENVNEMCWSGVRFQFPLQLPLHLGMLGSNTLPTSLIITP